jgi:hypothetical protein
MATKGTGWVARRASDFLPTLTRLVIEEWWHDVRGETSPQQAQLAAELAEIAEMTALSARATSRDLAHPATPAGHGPPERVEAL